MLIWILKFLVLALVGLFCRSLGQHVVAFFYWCRGDKSRTEKLPKDSALSVLTFLLLGLVVLSPFLYVGYLILTWGRHPW